MKHILALFCAFATLVANAQNETSTLDTAASSSPTRVRWGIDASGRPGYKGKTGNFQPVMKQAEVVALVNQKSGGSASLDYATYVTDKTSAGIQAAVNAATPGATLILYGVYNCSAGTVNISKSINLLGYNATLDGGTASSVLLKITNCSDVSVRRIKFTSANKSIGYGMILVNEEGAVNNLTIDGCEFTGPSGQYFNGISLVAYSENSGTGVFHTNLTVTNNNFHDLPRMGVEFVNHQWNGTVRFVGLNVSDNVFDNLGLLGDDGMAISFSGEIKNVQANNNRIKDFKGYGIEFIGTTDFSANNNVISSQKTFGGSYGSCGYNLTDGKNTEANPSNPGRGAQRGSINGGSVTVSGRPILIYYAYDISISGGYWKGGNYISLQHGDRLNLVGLTVESLYQSCIIFDGTSNSVISGGRFSTLNAVGGKYEQIGFYNSSTNNYVTGAQLFGTSDNGANMKQNSGVTGNKWNVWFAGSILSN